jgi:molybdate transport system substrate-binding protein
MGAVRTPTPGSESIVAPRRETGARSRLARHLFLWVSLVAAPLAAASACGPSGEPVLVLAAASTIDALEAAVAEFHAAGEDVVEVSFGSTSVLARQIEEGAPAGLFLSASVEWADYVEERVAVTRRVALAGNQLAVVVPAAASSEELTLQQVAAAAHLQRLAIADPASVPAGIYAAQALRALGLWEAVQPRLLPAVDVRAALALVAGAEADAGFVYATDALGTGNRVRVITRVDVSLHDAIEYPLLLLGDAAQPAAERLFGYLTSAAGRAHFHQRGFVDPSTPANR